MYVRSRLMTLKLLSHSHDVQGSVHAILKRTCTLGKKSLSHCLSADAHDAGLWSSLQTSASNETILIGEALVMGDLSHRDWQLQ